MTRILVYTVYKKELYVFNVYLYECNKCKSMTCPEGFLYKEKSEY